ncbi:hypothetical protein L2E82_18823 [Cichorium intybus]|uniref:Uncharacterized protein n=1 Tax=Cichorium intybus TaxID=13427 RepID=A0ACB9FBB9_CICIN|nr:hypothetical protein L2E82_18823 [Cichorium intybus]
MVETFGDLVSKDLLAHPESEVYTLINVDIKILQLEHKLVSSALFMNINLKLRPDFVSPKWATTIMLNCTGEMEQYFHTFKDKFDVQMAKKENDLTQKEMEVSAKEKQVQKATENIIELEKEIEYISIEAKLFVSG